MLSGFYEIFRTKFSLLPNNFQLTNSHAVCYNYSTAITTGELKCLFFKTFLFFLYFSFVFFNTRLPSCFENLSDGRTHSCLVVDVALSNTRCAQRSVFLSLLLSTHWHSLTQWHQLIVTGLSAEIRVENSSRPTTTDPITIIASLRMFQKISPKKKKEGPYRARHTPSLTERRATLYTSILRVRLFSLIEKCWEFLVVFFFNDRNSFFLSCSLGRRRKKIKNTRLFLG